MEEKNLKTLLNTLPQTGTVEWIGLRPAHRVPVIAVDRAVAVADRGLEGDRSCERQGGKRQVTLIQAEHLVAIGGFLGREAPPPEMLRRNIVIRGINLLALKDKRFQVGEAVLEMTGLCHPCSRMEELFGPGGYNAVRGHGGITARVVHDGGIHVGDSLRCLGPVENADAKSDGEEILEN